MKRNLFSLIILFGIIFQNHAQQSSPFDLANNTPIRFFYSGNMRTEMLSNPWGDFQVNSFGRTIMDMRSNREFWVRDGSWNTIFSVNPLGESFIAGDFKVNDNLHVIGNIGVGTTAPSFPLSVRNDNGVINTVHNLASFSRFEAGTGNAGLNIHYEANGTDVTRTLLYFPGGIGVSFRVFNQGPLDVLHLNSNGSVGINTTETGNHNLAVEGSIGAREVVVEAGNWSDFVFDQFYKLPTLEEVEKHIIQNGHLPEIPTEAEVVENGINLGDMDAKLLQKIEELTLYMINMNKHVKQLESENQKLKEKISILEAE